MFISNSKIINHKIAYIHILGNIIMSNDDNTNQQQLYENHRRTIGANLMKELCGKNDDAKRKGEPTISV
jgi:hypothetical protein